MDLVCDIEHARIHYRGKKVPRQTTSCSFEKSERVTRQSLAAWVIVQKR